MNNHAARIERVAQIRPADMNQPPMAQEVAAELARMESDPAYISKWTDEQVEKWIAQLEAELAP